MGFFADLPAFTNAISSINSIDNTNNISSFLFTEKTTSNDDLKQPVNDFKTQTLDLVEKIQQTIDDITRLKDIIQQIEENIKVETEKLKELVNSKKQMKEELSNSKLKAQELIDKFNQDLDNIISKV